MSNELTTSRQLAPDELKPGLFVAPLFVYTEHLPFSAYFGCDEPWRSKAVVRTQWLPSAEAGVPLRIVSVCLPFILAERPDGTHSTLDTRRVSLALLSERFAAKATKRLRARPAPAGIEC